MEKFYRGGRYYWRGPKKGTEEPDAVEVPAGSARFCRHKMTPGLDPRFSVCATNCGMASGPMSIAQARAVAEALRRNRPDAERSGLERALIAFAEAYPA